MTETTFEPIELPSRYSKAIVAILTAAVTVLVAALTDGLVTTVETVNVAVAILTAVSVYLVPNLPAGIGQYAKLGVAILGTALQALVDVLATGSLTSQGILVVLLAALGAVSVGIIPNTNATPELDYDPQHD